MRLFPSPCFQSVTKLGLQKLPRLLRVLGLLEQVRVDPKRYVRVGVPKLPAHEDHIGTLRDQERGKGVPEIVEAGTGLPELGSLGRRVKPSTLDVRPAERLPLPVVKT